MSTVPTGAVPGSERVADRPASMARMLLDRIAAGPDREALRYRDGEGGGWTSLTWAETGERVRAISAGLLALGVAPEDRVAIAAGTRVEWVLADFAIMCAGAATTTVYPSSVDADVAHILADSASRVVFAEDAEQVAKVRKHRAELPGLTTVVTFDGTREGDWVLPLEELEARGREHLRANPGCVEDTVAGIGPDHLATLIYTSGTTGRPKGVLLAHDCWTYEGRAVDALGLLSTEDLQLLWLPLSHVFGKMMLAMQLAIGYPTAIDGDVTRLVENLADVRPTFTSSVPRIFEKVHARVVATARSGGGAKAKVFDWAVKVGSRVSERRQQGRRPGRLLAAQHRLADRLVFSKVRERFGGRMRYFISGSAPLSPEIARFFDAAGMLVLEGYGLTETSAAAFVNRPTSYRFGTVGLPLPGTEVSIAADGEILVRGPGVMRGYQGMPVETAEVLTPDGWLRTGDIGQLEDGFLRITDRKKDLIKTSNGKYVAPQIVESHFKAVCPHVSQVLVYGESRPFVTALVSLDPEGIAGWARENGLPDAPYAELVARPEVHAFVEGHVQELNRRLARWETVKTFAILDRDLTVEDGELTPSLKVKRRIVEARYRDVLDRLYAPVP